MRVKVLIFKKFHGVQILFFYENWHDASYYIKEQTKKYKFETWLLRSTILNPPKSAFLVFEENPPQKMFQLWFSFKNNKLTNVLLVGIFENAQKN